MNKQELLAGMKLHGIPEYMRASLVNYFIYHDHVGGFLTAVFENDFARAVCAADPDNLAALRGYATFMHNEVPSDSWGSPKAVKEWIEQ